VYLYFPPCAAGSIKQGFTNNWSSLGPARAAPRFLTTAFYLFYVLFAIVLINLFIGIVTDAFPKARMKSQEAWEKLITRMMQEHTQLAQAVSTLPRYRRWLVMVCWRGNRLRVIQSLHARSQLVCCGLRSQQATASSADMLRLLCGLVCVLSFVVLLLFCCCCGYGICVPSRSQPTEDEDGPTFLALEAVTNTMLVNSLITNSNDVADGPVGGATGSVVGANNGVRRGSLMATPGGALPGTTSAPPPVASLERSASTQLDGSDTYAYMPHHMPQFGRSVSIGTEPAPMSSRSMDTPSGRLSTSAFPGSTHFSERNRLSASATWFASPEPTPHEYVLSAFAFTSWIVEEMPLFT